MTNQPETPIKCFVCGQFKRMEEFAPGGTIREPVAVEILRKHPTWTVDQKVCFECLNRFRAEHVRHLLEEEKGELTSLEERVIDSIRQQESVSSNVNEHFDRRQTFGERLADRLADFGGSWRFLIMFGVVLLGWMTYNASSTSSKPFDPYPFILLNLVLSCLAAVQAPVILMSQNRQEAKDRLRSEYDYQVNLKAELEIRLLHTKVDQLLTHQWQRLLDIQELQVELMEDVANKRPNDDPKPLDT